jgi:hypothetical protein
MISCNSNADMGRENLMIYNCMHLDAVKNKPHHGMRISRINLVSFFSLPGKKPELPRFLLNAGSCLCKKTIE